MILTFVVPARKQPNGAALAIYEFANAMRRRGHTIHLVHRLIANARTLKDIEWFSFEEGIEHHLPQRFGRMAFPAADFVFTRLSWLTPENGLSLRFVQGFTSGTEKGLRSMRAPGPKICVSRWLVSAGLAAGIPSDELVHVPLGVDHERFRVVNPIADRPPRIAMMYGAHPVKGTPDGLEALTLVKERMPEAEMVIFGKVRPPGTGLPDGVTVLRSPSQVRLREIYNGSSLYLCPSVSEGFGFPSVESMACGCALVTTSNGGSDEFARHRQTALVCPPGDTKAMADHVLSLLREDSLRVKLARNGSRFVARFDWDRSAELLESFLNEYAVSASAAAVNTD